MLQVQNSKDEKKNPVRFYSGKKIGYLQNHPKHKSDEQESSPWQHWEPENDEAISLMLSPKNWF